MITHILPQRRHKHGAERGVLVAEPDPRPALKADLSQKDVQNAVIRVVDLEPELADDHGGDQHRHEVDREEHALALDVLAQRQRQTQREGELEKDGKQREQQGVAQGLHKADGIAGKELFIIGKADEGFGPDALPVKEAVIKGRPDRRD